MAARRHTQHTLTASLRQSVFSRLAGYEDTNDAERLSVDPAMRHVVGGRAKRRNAASTSHMGRFETKVLTDTYHVEVLMDLSDKWIDRVRERKPVRELILDMDSSVSETYGEQEGTGYNGHFGCTCYHPLFCFNQFGDLERALLPEGHVHSVDDWRSVLEPVVARYRDEDISRFFQGDAAFANPNIYTFLEEEGYRYAIRLPANQNLQRAIEHLLTRPVGRPSKAPKVLYEGFTYQAKSWDQARRVVAKVEWHQGELFPRVGFIVTNLRRSDEGVVKFYNGRGTVEQWIREGKNAVKWTRLSCHDFVDNQVRLQLFALAYNLGNFLRRLALPRSVKHWSLTTLREKLVKIGAKVFLIVDRHPVHRSGRVRRWLRRHEKKISMFLLPAYSHELNPDEYLNNDVKSNAVGRRRAVDQREMMADVRGYLRSTQKQAQVVRSYFQADSVQYAAV